MKFEYRNLKQYLKVIRISDYQVVGIRASGHQFKYFFIIFVPDILVH
jgi:hypothetical protein